jgi:mRNA interferase MazF
MAVMKPGDIIKVPFPYTNRPVFQRRPALVVARFEHGRIPALLWVLMITSAENRGWPGDVEIADLALAGLPVASVVRTAKIATIEAKDGERLGTLDFAGFVGVCMKLKNSLSAIGNLE